MIKLNNLLAHLMSVCDNVKLMHSHCVGVSGGSDSLALVLMLKELGYDPIACLIDHRLHSLSSDELEKTKRTLDRHHIKHLSSIWEHSPIRTGVEEKAREARYKLLFQMCRESSIKQLCIAHHMDDQVETFFLNLIRGSGLDGLCAMPLVKNAGEVEVIRPLLSVRKSVLQDYLIDHNINWIDDPSNVDTRILRNKLRQIFGTMNDYDLIVNRISKTTEILQSIKSTMDLYNENNFIKLVDIIDGIYHLNRNSYLDLTSTEMLSLLSMVLMRCSGSKYKGRLCDIERVVRWISEPNHQKKRTLMQCVIHLTGDMITISAEK